MRDIECPYCENEQDEPDDCHEPNERYEVECNKCGKVFHAICEYQRTWYTEATPCLNEGGEHIYTKITGYPEEYFVNSYRCKFCDERKTMTPEEFNNIK